jgi:hypothetical protein
MFVHIAGVQLATIVTEICSRELWLFSANVDKVLVHMVGGSPDLQT